MTTLIDRRFLSRHVETHNKRLILSLLYLVFILPETFPPPLISVTKVGLLGQQPWALTWRGEKIAAVTEAKWRHSSSWKSPWSQAPKCLVMFLPPLLIYSPKNEQRTM